MNEEAKIDDNEDEENGNNDAEEEEVNQNGDAIIDPFDPVARTAFTDSIRDCVDGEELIRIVETLPRINGAFEKGKTKVRMLKMLKHCGQLDATFTKTATSYFNNTDHGIFKGESLMNH
jgi:hypothetical protein